MPEVTAQQAQPRGRWRSRLGTLLRAGAGPAATVLIVLLLGGCDPPASPNAAPSALPTPTVDVRLSAADAYLAAMTAYNAAIGPVEAKICSVANTVPSLKSCWSKKHAIQRRFDAAVSTIAFPDDLRADAQTLHYVTGRLEGSMAGISASPNPARDFNDLGEFSSASVDFLQISSNLRQELGIIATPSP